MTPALLRIVQAYRGPVGPAVTKAVWAALAAALIGAALWARQGTPGSWFWSSVLLCVTLGLLCWRIVFPRRFLDARRAVTVVLSGNLRDAGTRVRRAHELVSRAEADVSGTSPDLAKLHYERTLERVSLGAVSERAQELARRYRVAALLGAAFALCALFVAPRKTIEGANVYLAQDGRAPLLMPWVEFLEVDAQPPAYLGLKERPLMSGAVTTLPDGTKVSFRGKPLVDGRELVLTDGDTEVPLVEDGTGAVAADWELTKSTRLAIAARFGEVLIFEPRAVGLRAVPDQLPRVRLAEAPKTFELDTLEKLELRWSAADDHALSQVDLVLRSAGREERRTLERFPGDKSRGQGGHVLYPDDAFLKRAFLPVTVRVEARDNDPRSGARWGESEPFTIELPSVGAPEHARHRGLSSVRDALLDYWLQLEADLELAAATEPTYKRRVARRETLRAAQKRLKPLVEEAERVLSTNYGGLTVPRGWRAFATGRFERLTKALRRDKDVRQTIESAVLAFDAGIRSSARRDAKQVAKRLADVAEEAAYGARLSQQSDERKLGLERLAIANSVLSSGGKELQGLGVLGADLGSVTLSELMRIHAAESAEDYFHAELAAVHLAARLRRPNPSFGSKGGSGGTPGMGDGQSGGGQAGSGGGQSPSDADQAFDRLAADLEQLTQEHADATERTASTLRDAMEGLDKGSSTQEAARRARALREAVERLPQPGEAPGTSRAAAALSREHAGAMAHEFERLGFEQAVSSGQRAKSAAEDALRKGGLDFSIRSLLEAALPVIEENVKWAEQRAQETARLTEQAAQDALGEVSAYERELAERAERMESERGEKAGLPEEAREKLRQANRLMQDAARRLSLGRGREGLSLQRQAQRLLEESNTGETKEPSPSESASEPSNSPQASPGGRRTVQGGDVPDASQTDGAVGFRRRVLEGLGKTGGGRLSSAVQRYAEGLLR